MSAAADPSPQPLVLVDGSSYLFRAFHALPPLTAPDGHPTGAIKGVVSMLRRLQSDHPDAELLVVFDAPGKTFRDELFEQYKAQRTAMPDELRVQVEPLYEVIRAMGLALLIVPGVEADDVIGTLATQASAQGRDTLISTGDKDMAQLVDARVRLVNTMTDTQLDPAGVEAKFGVPPERIIDYLALVGDTSDNIPGVPKVGPKTAAKWLQTHGDLDALVDHAAEIPGKVGESLRAHLDQLALSRQLATIRVDLDLDDLVDHAKAASPEPERLLELFDRFGFKAWSDELDVPSTADPAVSYTTVLDLQDLRSWVQRLQNAGAFAFDTETTSLDYMQAELVGLSFAIEPGEAAYVPCGHRYLGAPEQIPLSEVLAQLRPVLESDSVAKVGQNLKYDANVLARYAVALRGIRDDTMLESYVLNSTAVRHDMDSLARHYLGHRCIAFSDVAGKGASARSFDQVEVAAAANYAAEDADICLRLHHRLAPKLAEVPTLERLYREIEVPLVPVLSAMERNGVLVDAHLLSAQSGELSERLHTLKAEAEALAGRPFNLGSPKQLQEILFTEQGLPVLRKTPKGQPSTADPVLQELALDFPLPKVIIEHRSLAKLKSTYTDRLPERIDPDTGRVHTSYHQAVTATGRLSSSDPNLQNIPVRTEEGRRIRQAFVAPAGYQLLAADYSQIELRIMAHLSGDPGLVQAFADNLDVHRATAAEVFGVEFESVSAEQRRQAKAINFGLIYGMSGFGLARQLGIGRTEAEAYIERYFERYPGVRAYMDRTREQASEQGYVETLYGRRLYLPDIQSSNGNRKRAAERTAINAPMQGTAADIIKRAMIRVHAWLATSQCDAAMVMQVHDELVLEVADTDLDAVQDAVRVHMEAAADLDVPLVVDLGTGANWDEAH
ncbi:MAG: DNA polymerase I [Pseudomonadota bacterium]|nr:DNA polymerase I [Pseudomonadota bacterium]